ncbi:MAG TPA: hypothetical protein PLL64_11850 [Rhodothermales bacterium]|nr:hypothetical protein [Rhodothermales bacterium]
MSKQDDLWKELESAQSKVVSFMVRFTQQLWQDEKGEPRISWRGSVKHVQGDENINFTDFAEGLSFMQSQLQAITEQTLERYRIEGHPASSMEEGLKIWEDATRRYTEMWVSGWQQSLAGAQQLKTQMDEVVRKTMTPWPEVINPVVLVEQNRQLKSEVEALKARILELERKQKPDT